MHHCSEYLTWKCVEKQLDDWNILFNCRAAGTPLLCSSSLLWVTVKGQGFSELHVSGVITVIMTEFMTVPSNMV